MLDRFALLHIFPFAAKTNDDMRSEKVPTCNLAKGSKVRVHRTRDIDFSSSPEGDLKLKGGSLSERLAK